MKNYSAPNKPETRNQTTMTDPTKFTKPQEVYDYLGVTEDTVRDYFLRVEKVMHHIIDLFGCNPESAKAYWVSGINPYYSQLSITSKKGLGLALVEYYGVPHKLATPFGSITFTNCSGKDDWFEKLKDTLGFKPLWGDEKRPFADDDPLTHDMLQGVDARDGTFGPVWTISKGTDGDLFDDCDFHPSHIAVPDMHHRVRFAPPVVEDIWKDCAPAGFKAARAEEPLYRRRAASA
jgi:hypothetical protein